MVIFFLTTQEAVCRKIASSLQVAGHIISVYTDPERFYADVNIMGPEKIGLLAVDYKAYDHDSFNAYESMKNRKRVIPIIFYNDPYPREQYRLTYWRVKNQVKFKEHLEPEKLQAAYPAMKIIHQVLCGDIKEEVVLLCSPQKPGGKRLAFNLEDFCVSHRIPSSRRQLLEFLFENRGRRVSVNEMCCHIWGKYSQKNAQNLYTYIYDLRKAFSDEKSFSMNLSHDAQGLYQLTVEQLEIPAEYHVITDVDHSSLSIAEYMARKDEEYKAWTELLLRKKKESAGNQNPS